jgi:RIO kinase 1
MSSPIEHGPTIIDLCQVLDAAADSKEIWYIYESGNLTPDVNPTADAEGSNRHADVDSILREIDDARDEAIRRKQERS